ncbi:MAG: type IV pilus secretin PilQ [Candidatus Competibacteraceae bacterium]|nr:MAG: type IV pilus secretin PilQ [Candidatus Competibacteraceae bacterium]
MTSRSTNEGQYDRRAGGGWLPRWLMVIGLVWGVVLGGAWTEATAADIETAKRQPVLQAVDISPLAGNRLQIRFQLSEAPKGPPSSFTINEPARIVLDFLDTTNGLSSRQQNINVGVADRISVLEGSDRTRASLNLARMVPYQVQVQGKTVLLTLENAGVAAARTLATTPVSSVVAAAPKRSEAPVVSPKRVTDVDFKRGPAGQGVITLKLSNPNIAVDVRQEGNQIIADFQGAGLPRGQERRLDVTDFATPVTVVEALNKNGSTQLTIKPNPPFEYLAYQANDLYVIEVRPPQKSSEEEEKEAQLDPSKKKYKGDLLSLNFQDIEVRAILQILADFTGLNIVVSDSVKGNLTLRLQNVPWDQALDIILRTKGLAMRQNGNVVFIAPTEELAAREKLELESRKSVQELVPLRNEIIQVNYAKAQTLADLLKKAGEKGQSMLSPRGNVVADEATNTLIVQDIPDRLEEVRNLVTKLDRPTKQVMIDSRLVIASTDFAKDIGVRFGVTGVGQSGNNVGAVSGNLTGTNDIVNSAANNLIATGQPYPVAIPDLASRLGVNMPATPALGNPASIALSILGADYLVDLELSALQAEAKGEVISNPRVVTADLKKASILQGTQIPYSTSSANTGTSTSFKDAVLKLEVTPQITPDDRIRMDLVVQKDTPGVNVPQAGGGSVPSIDTRKVETQVLVNNGETVVLGGVFEQNKTNGGQKVPLLGDIPLLGYLFQKSSDAITKRELLIFVTPQILKEGALAER